MRGRLVDVQGQRIAGAQVLLAPGLGWSRLDQGDDLDCAPPGPLELAIWWPDGEQPVPFTVEVVPEVPRYVVDLARLPR